MPRIYEYDIYDVKTEVAGTVVTFSPSSEYSSCSVLEGSPPLQKEQ